MTRSDDRSIRHPNRHGHEHEDHSAAVDSNVSCLPKQLPERLRVEAAQTAIRINPANGVGFASITGASRALGIEPQRISVIIQKYWGPQQRQLTVSFAESHAGPRAMTWSDIARSSQH